VLRRPGGDRGGAGEHVGGRGVPDVEAVVAHVIATVAGQREVGVADARRARSERAGLGAGRCGRRRQQSEDDGEDKHSSAHPDLHTAMRAIPAR
jgi:hypothetical protein